MEKNIKKCEELPEISDIIKSDETVLKPKKIKPVKETMVERRLRVFGLDKKFNSNGEHYKQMVWDERTATILIEKIEEFVMRKQDPFICQFLMDEMGLYPSQITTVSKKFPWFRERYDELKEYLREQVEKAWAENRVNGSWARTHLQRNFKGYNEKSEITLEHKIVKFKFGNDIVEDELNNELPEHDE